jgi:hypothetical protein
MTNQPPRPGLDALVDSIGVAAERLDAIQATEGAAGNISIGVCWPLDLAARFTARDAGWPPFGATRRRTSASSSSTRAARQPLFTPHRDAASAG